MPTTDAKHLVSSVARFGGCGAGLAGFVPLPLLDRGLQPNGNELDTSHLAVCSPAMRPLQRPSRPSLALSLAALTLGGALTACGGAAKPSPTFPPPAREVPPTAATTTDGGTTTEAAADPFALGAPMADDPPTLADAPPPDLAAWSAARSVVGVGAAPATCDAFVQRRAVTKASACSERPPALAALDAALLATDAAQRDAALVAIESCTGLPPGLVRALRADLGPVECGDKLVDATIGQPAGISGNVLGTLVAQSLAARLARTVGKPPPLAPPYDKAHVLAYVKGPLKTWIEAQAVAIEAISRNGAKLSGYAKGLVAVEAGLADLRFVERVRSIPMPTEFEKDPEIKTAYLASLDQNLEPRKDRGRDAALIGLRELAAVGVLHDARVDKARSLLGKLYAGRRIDALDALLLPELPPVAQLTLEERLAAKLPTFYATALLDGPTVVQPAIVRALLVQGLPASLRVAAAKPADLVPEARATYARGRVELGRTYWRAVDFDQAAQIEVARRKESEEASFLVALSLALRGGPKDAAEMMHAPSPAALRIRNVAALDALTRGKPGKYSGMAAFDAALLLATAPPEGAGSTYFADLAKRFHAAAALLGGAEKGIAEEHARTAEATAAVAAPPK